MATTLFDAMLRLARRTGWLLEGKQYVGSTNVVATTVICALLTQEDDYWNNSTIFLVRDAAGAGAAPEGESREVSDFVAATDTLTVTPAFSAAVTTGDEFAILPNKFTRSKLLMAIDAALKWYGAVLTEDTSLTTAADTREYTLPDAVKANEIREVWLATESASEYDWVPSSYWRVDYGAGKLIFHYQPASPFKIKLVYKAFQAAISNAAADTSVISSYFNIDTVVEYAYYYLLQLSLSSDVGVDRAERDLMNFAYQNAEKMRREHPLPRIPQQARYTRRGSRGNDGCPFNVKLP